ncbi:MAG TPA: hypothetical protein VLY24_21990 [Bryobacteraceae bacterium]|nr:hypothetical protein [Bryobacteraceae bacterium]
MAIDFTNLVKRLVPQATEEQIKALNGMAVKLHAVRAQEPVIDILWTQGTPPAGRELIESGAKQTLGGFFQVYWEIFGSSTAPGPRDPIQIEAGPRGGHILHSTSNGMKLSIETDAYDVPTTVVGESPAMKITMQPRFTPSQIAVPSDLRRLTSVSISEQVGTNHLNLEIITDYQDVGGFHIPRHVVFDVGGAYSVPMEFSGCSATGKASATPK